MRSDAPLAPVSGRLPTAAAALDLSGELDSQPLPARLRSALEAAPTLVLQLDAITTYRGIAVAKEGIAPVEVTPLANFLLLLVDRDAPLFQRIVSSFFGKLGAQHAPALVPVLSAWMRKHISAAPLSSQQQSTLSFLIDELPFKALFQAMSREVALETWVSLLESTASGTQAEVEGGILQSSPTAGSAAALPRPAATEGQLAAPAISAACNSLGTSCKLVATLAHAFSGLLVAALHAPAGSGAGAHGPRARSAISSLLGAYTRVLQVPLLLKDCVLQVTLALGRLLLLLLLATPEGGQQQVGGRTPSSARDAETAEFLGRLLLLTHSEDAARKRPVDASDADSVAAPAAWTEADSLAVGLTPAWFESLTRTAQCGLVRALAICLPPGVLLLPSSAAGTGSASPPSTIGDDAAAADPHTLTDAAAKRAVGGSEEPSPASCCFFSDALLLRCVLPLCADPDDTLRLFALRTLETLLGVALRLAKHTSPAPRGLLPLPVFRALLATVMTSWEHADKRISGAMPSLFDALLSLVQACGESRALRALAATLLHRPEAEPLPCAASAAAVAAPPSPDTASDGPIGVVPSSPSTYAALLRLLPHVGCAALVSLRPALFSDLLQSIASPATNPDADGRLADLLRSLLAAARAETEDGLGLTRTPLKGTFCLPPRPTTPPAPPSSPEAEALLRAEAHTAWTRLWLPDLVGLLLSRSRWLRHRAAFYCLAEVLKVDLGAAPLITAALRSGACGAPVHTAPAPVDGSVLADPDEQGSGALGDDLSTPWERCLDTTLQVERLFVAGAPSAALPPAGDCSCRWLSRAELHAALVTADPELRVSAAEVAVGSLRSHSTQAPQPHEYEALLLFLRCSARAGGCSTDFRKRAVQCLTVTCKRALGAGRGEARAAATAAATGRPSPGPPAGQGGGALGAAVAFSSSLLGGVLVPCLYPGAPFGRIVFALECTLCLCETLGAAGPPASGALSDAPAPGTPSGALRALLSPHAVTALINCLFLQWERVRDLAGRVLEAVGALGVGTGDPGGGGASAHPAPSGGLSGYEGPAQVGMLARWALGCLTSPRVLESEGGTRLLALLHRHYVVRLGWRLQLHPRVQVTPPATGALARAPITGPPALDSSLAFARQLLCVLRARTAAFRSALGAAGFAPQAGVQGGEMGEEDGSSAGASPLPHGAVLALRTLLMDLDLKGIVGGPDNRTRGAGTPALDAWRALLRETVAAALDCAAAAAAVVAGSNESDGGVVGGPPTAQQAQAQREAGEEDDLLPLGRADCAALFAAVGAPPLNGSGGGGSSGAAEEEERDDNGAYSSAGDLGLAGEEESEETQGGVGGVMLGVPSTAASAVAAATAGQASSPAAPGAGAPPPQADADAQHTASVLVMSAWHCTREVAVLLGELVARAPLPTSLPPGSSDGSTGEEEDDADGPWLLASSEVVLIGDSLLSLLLRVRHMGAIHCISEALQTLCARLLALPVVPARQPQQQRGEAAQAPLPPAVDGASTPIPAPADNAEGAPTNSAPSHAPSFSPHASVAHPLSLLPLRWLRSLFTRMVARRGQQFILRRSGGFGLAFIAILEAEPRNAPPGLLRAVCAALLLLCGESLPPGADAPTQAHPNTRPQDPNPLGLLPSHAFPRGSAPSPTPWRTRVHALNTLRGVFRVAALASEASSFLAPSLMAALGGFPSPSWAVRNSSLMLYASVVSRAVGFNNRNSASSAVHAGALGGAGPAAGGDLENGLAAGVPTATFFSRFPALHGFLLAELRAGTAAGVAAPSSLSSLYPVLLLLSRLRPESPSGSDARTSSTDPFSVAGFTPLLLAAATRQPNALVRTIAASALKALLPLHQCIAIAPVLGELMGAGPRGRGVRCPWNAVHGALLCLRGVLQRCAAEGAATGAVEAACAVAPQLWVQCGEGGYRGSGAGDDAPLLVIQRSLRDLLAHSTLIACSGRGGGGSAAALAVAAAAPAGSPPLCAPGMVRAVALEVTQLLLMRGGGLAAAAGGLLPSGRELLKQDGSGDDEGVAALCASLLGVGASLPNTAATGTSGDIPHHGRLTRVPDPGAPLASGIAAHIAAEHALTACLQLAVAAPGSAPTPGSEAAREAARAHLSALQALLTHGEGEVRVAAAKAVKSALKHADTALAAAARGPHAGRASPGSGPSRDAILRAVALHLPSVGEPPRPLLRLLAQAAEREQHPDARRYASHAAALLMAAAPPSLLLPQGPSGKASEGVLPQMVRLLAACRDTNTRGLLIRALGAVACAAPSPAPPSLSDHASASAATAAGSGAMVTLRAWQQAVVSAARIGHSYKLRLAAAASVRRSGAARRWLCVSLPPATPQDRFPAPEPAGPWAWGLLLCLLVDQDDEVREEARAAVAEALQAVILVGRQAATGSPANPSAAGEAFPGAEAAGIAWLAACEEHLPLPLPSLRGLLLPAAVEDVVARGISPRFDDHAALQVAFFLLGAVAAAGGANNGSSTTAAHASRALLRQFSSLVDLSAVMQWLGDSCSGVGTETTAAAPATGSTSITDTTFRFTATAAAATDDSGGGAAHGAVSSAWPAWRVTADEDPSAAPAALAPDMFSRPLFATDVENDFVEPLEMRAFAAAALAMGDQPRTLESAAAAPSPAACWGAGREYAAPVAEAEIGLTGTWVGGPEFNPAFAAGIAGAR